MERHAKGTPAADIRRELDAKYAKVGKPMPTPLPR